MDHIEKYNELTNTIKRIGTLSDDWDGYRAIPPSKDIIQTSLKFLEQCKSEYLLITDMDVFPNPNGTITFWWDNGHSLHSIGIEIGSTSYGTTVYGPGPDDNNSVRPNDKLFEAIEDIRNIFEDF